MVWELYEKTPEMLSAGKLSFFSFSRFKSRRKCGRDAL